MSLPNGGNPRWHIHRSADPKLSPSIGPMVNTDTEQFQQFTAKQQRVAMIKIEAMKRFRLERAKGESAGLRVGEWINDLVADPLSTAGTVPPAH